MSVTAAHIVIGVGVQGALGGTVLLHLVASSTFLRDAEGHGHLKHMPTTVGGSHFAGTGVDASIGAARGTGHSPTRLPAGTRRLAVLAAGAHLCMGGEETQLGQCLS